MGVLAICAAALSAPTQAQEYPSKPIKIIVGFGAGGTTDAIARYYALKMSEVLKAPVIVDNKPGAGQTVAIKSTIAAAPDGYTLYLATASSLSQGPGLRKNLYYDPMKDFSLIGLIASVPGVIVVSQNLPVRNLRELATYSNANPTQLNYASSGVGASSHLQTAYLLNLTGIKMAHIPYKSDADIMREVSAGSIQLGMSSVQGALPSITGGRVRALAVTGSRRVKALPGVPSLTESDFKGLDGIDPYSFYGLVGPAGVPPAIVAKLNDAINRVSTMPDVVAHMEEKLVAEPGVGNPEAFRAYIQKDLSKWQAFSKFITLAE
ncbi:tripartite tricarboxylate transporter substrate binding protein [Ramlibacter sp. 2FC]|uniref:Bug family tripartite tricarboxylate transporter substrate binding protein n=1 Tax=Ramlibacter sp. 2FC TaxID=2502188 RepID=UPI0010F9F41C|nr:tripartite tricarboxylate transporter substrate binding protein [Ramlibacter sp. 2FC]